jgi:hypothetical protein
MSIGAGEALYAGSAGPRLILTRHDDVVPIPGTSSLERLVENPAP